MTTPWGLLGGERITRGRLSVPGVGVWSAVLEMEGAPELSGSVTLALGDLRLSGTIAPDRSGTDALVARYLLVGGAGGWSSVLPPKGYHSDSGVRASTVAEDAAREAGETLGRVEVAAPFLGVDYVRSRGPAAVTLSDVAGGVAWYVDLDGTTHIAARPEVEAERGSYEVLDVDPAERLVTLAVDDLTRFGIGSVLSERLDSRLTVRSYEVEIEAGSWTVRAWCGAPSTSSSRLARTLRSFVQRVASDRLYGVYEYRVVRQGTDGRLEVRPVESGSGLPDLGPIDVYPGVAGASAEVSEGTTILVEFISGDRRRPIVRGLAPRGGSGHAATKLVLDVSGASSSILLGASASKKLAYAEDVASALSQVQATFDAFIPGSGGAEFPTPFVAPSAASIGTSKTVAE